MASKNRGWIKLYRSIEDNWVWNTEPYSYGQAWVDLILMCNHESNKIPYKDEIIEIQKGQKLTSIRKLSEKWQWGKKRTEKFLKRLESDGMLTKKREAGGTLLTLTQYGIMQGLGDTKGDSQETVKGQPGDSQGSQTRMYKNVKRKKEEASPKKNSFDSFDQRTIDADELEKRMLKKAKEVANGDRV